MTHEKCSWGEGITVKPDGIHELSPHIFKEEEVIHNCTVYVSRCIYCGEISISWRRNERSGSGAEDQEDY